MKITGNALFPLAFGYVSAHEGPDGVEFERFSASQREAYAASLPCFSDLPSNYFLNNCDTDAGIMLDFLTDARRVTLDIGALRVANGAEEQAVDLLVNGRLRATLRQAGEVTVTLRPTTDADGSVRPSHITVCLPYFARASVRSLTLTGGDLIRPVEKQGLWLCLGDSITHGCQASCPSRTYVARLAQTVGYEMLNQGSGGWVHHPSALSPIPAPDGAVRQPDVVTVAYGINDLGRKTQENNRADMQAFYDALLPLYPAARIFMISPLWTAPMRDPTHDEFFGGMYRLFDEMHRRLEVAYPGRVTFVDGRRLMPHDVHCVRPDGVHPVDKGFRYYAARLHKTVTPYL